MEKIVLVVDDEDIIRNMVATRLTRLNAGFTVAMAPDGFEAVKILERGGVSLVISDVKMPNMDGLELLSYIMQRHPSIPCIIMTGYSTSKTKKRASELGAVEFINKPFEMADLTEQVLSILKSQEEGGVLRGVSLSVFVHLVEMESKTCTIRVSNRSIGANGSLFFMDGDLIDARSGSLTGIDAAYEVFSWEKSDIEIQNSCSAKERKITMSLQGIMLETMRLKDEFDSKLDAGLRDEPKPAPRDIDPMESEAPMIESVETLSAGDVIIDLIHTNVREKLMDGVDRVAKDPYWDSFIATARDIGVTFNSGSLRLVSLSATDGHDYILVPAEETVVVGVWKKSVSEKLRDFVLEITKSR